MNLPQLTETFNDGEREWTSMLCYAHTGVNDSSLLRLTADLLPPKVHSTEINELIADLNQHNHQRDAILTKLVNKIISCFNPNTRADYLWYLHFTVAVLLLKDVPVSFYTLQGHLLTKCFSRSATIWDSDPAKLDYFASHLYDIMENDKNLIFVTSQIENRSSFGFYLSLCMLWKSIYRCIDEQKSMFRLYPPSNLIAVTKKMTTKKLDTDFESVLDFIMLHSKISSLIFHRKHRSPLDKCYEEFFVFDVRLIKTLKDFLDKTLTRADAMWRRDNENLNYLTLVEYLQIDISEFDTLIRTVEVRIS